MVERLTEQFRGVITGSGNGTWDREEVCQKAIDLVERDESSGKIHVVYIGTATYDLDENTTVQTAGFRNMGCIVTPLKVAGDTVPSYQSMSELLNTADIVFISGGNSLWMLDRWKRVKLDVLIKDCIKRGVVMCGGSAAAICWFDVSQADSADPVTFKDVCLRRGFHNGESEEPWEYIALECMGILPGFCVPHFDKIQSNGVLRAYNAADMILPFESGLGLDHFAGLIMDRGQYTTFAVSETTGCNVNGKFDGDRTKGKPGVWAIETVRACVPKKQDFWCNFV